jgi:hypothetical protein
MSLERQTAGTLEADVDADERFERSLFWREVLIAAATAAVLIVRALVL